MFGIDGFEPWMGVDGKYEASLPRVMVLGDLSLDAPLTDRECILRKIGGAPDLIFTNFEQAVLGMRHWQDDFRPQVRAFWERTAFYNYNPVRMASEARAPLTLWTRSDPRHARLLSDMLRHAKPTHVIVWGEANWQALAVADAAWEAEPPIYCREVDEPCRGVTLDGHRSRFTRVSHPSAGFAYERWSGLLRSFLARAA